MDEARASMAGTGAPRQAGEAPEHTLAERLDRLMTRAPRKDGRDGPYLLQEIANGVNQAAGGRLLSAPYLSQLRTGQRANPGYRRLKAIADFFGVDVGYFSDAEVAARTDEELDLLAKMREAGVTDIVLRADGLPPHALDAVRAMMDSLRKSAGLPPALPPDRDNVAD